MDRIFIRDLKVETVIGVLDWERSVKQLLLLDLDIEWDIRPAAADDNLALTLDYKALSDGVIAFIESTEYLLIETLAENVAQFILREFNVPWLRLALYKPGAIPAARTLGVQIERGKIPG